jgi:hypothetical protein
MINLIANTAAQTVYLTLDEGRQYYSEAFTNYLLVITREENTDTGLDLAQIPTIELETQRYTQLTVTTVGLLNAGRYKYEVYGQNSAVNLDPENAAVVGLVERGLCTLTDGETYFFTPTQTIPNDYVAGQES